MSAMIRLLIFSLRIFQWNEKKKKKRPLWHYGSYVFMMYLAVSSPESQLEVLISLKQKRL